MPARPRARGARGARRGWYGVEVSAREHEWLWGWDPTPGIVSVWAEPDGRAWVWRRSDTGALTRELARYRPWLVVAEPPAPADGVRARELDGPGALRYRVDGPTLAAVTAAVLAGASRRRGHPVRQLRELDGAVIALPPEEQYLVASGRAYFRGLGWDDVRRLHLDLETTGLDPAVDRVFVVAVRAPDGATTVLEAAGDAPADEAALIARLLAHVAACDPDVIENHLRYAEALIALGDPTPATEALCKCIGQKATLRKDDQHLLEKLVQDAGSPACPPAPCRPSSSAPRRFFVDCRPSWNQADSSEPTARCRRFS